MTSEIYIISIMIMQSLLFLYPKLCEKYIEMILLNVDIWGHSPLPIQDMIITQTKSLIDSKYSCIKPSKLMDVLLNCVEISANKEEPNYFSLAKYSELIIKLCQEQWEDSMASILMSYANIFYIRRLSKYPLQIYYVLLILLEIHLTSNNIINPI